MFKYLLISIFILMINTNAYSLELIMISTKSCVYCKKFLKDVGLKYNIPQLPIVIVDDYDRPKWFIKAYKKKQIKPYRGVPIFIIWNEKEKKEIDRIVGYLGKERFYNDLQKIFVRIVNEKKD